MRAWILSLPFLLLRDVRLHDRDGRERREASFASATRRSWRPRPRSRRGEDRFAMAARRPRNSHASAMSPFTAAMRKLSPRTPARSAACASTGVRATRVPAGAREREVRHVVEHHLRRHPDHGRSIASGIRVVRRSTKRAIPRSPPRARARTAHRSNRRSRASCRSTVRSRSSTDSPRSRTCRTRSRGARPRGTVPARSARVATATANGTRQNNAGTSSGNGGNAIAKRKSRRRVPQYSPLLRKQPSASDHSRISFPSSADL